MVLVGCPDVTVPVIVASNILFIFFRKTILYFSLVSLRVRAERTDLYILSGSSVVRYKVGSIFLHRSLSTISNKHLC